MQYLTATQAASKLHCSEKTVRRWITEGRIPAFHPQGRKNRLAIAESDVERLAGELAQFETPAAEQDTDTSSLVERINQLEQRVTELERKTADQGHIIAALNDAMSHVGTPVHAAAVAESRPVKTRPIASTSHTELPVDVPTGSILVVDFAKAHTVSPATFRDHVVKGFTPSLSIPNPARPGQRIWYVTPEQQQQAIDFWTRNGTRYTPNPESYPALKYPGVQSEPISEGADTTDTSES